MGQTETPSTEVLSRSEDKSRGIRAAETGSRLLEALCDYDQPVELRALATSLNLSPSATHAYLTSYCRIGLVRQDAVSKRYSLGPFALELGLAELQSLDPIELGLQALRRLSVEMGRTVAMSVWGSHGPTVIRVHRTHTPLHATLIEGTTLSLRNSATGRVFAAFMAGEAVEAALKVQARDMRESKADDERFRTELKKIRVQGMSRIVDRPVPGLVSLSVPVFDHSNTIVCALTATGRQGDYDDSVEGKPARTLLQTAQTLSRRLGMRWPIGKRTTGNGSTHVAA